MFILLSSTWYLMSTTFSNGCLGSHNDEERSEMRYVMRIAGPRESLNFWTHIALPGYARLHASLSVCGPHSAITLVMSCNMVLLCLEQSFTKICWTLVAITHHWIPFWDLFKRKGLYLVVCAHGAFHWCSNSVSSRNRILFSLDSDTICICYILTLDLRFVRVLGEFKHITNRRKRN